MWQVGQNCLTCHIAPFRRGGSDVLLWPVNCRKSSACPGKGNAIACPTSLPRMGNVAACPTSLLPGRKSSPAPQAFPGWEMLPPVRGKGISPPPPQAFPHLMIPFTSSYMSPHRRHICFGELLKRLRRVRASLRRSWVLRVRIVFIWNSSMQISFRCWRIS